MIQNFSTFEKTLADLGIIFDSRQHLASSVLLTGSGSDSCQNPFTTHMEWLVLNMIQTPKQCSICLYEVWTKEYHAEF
jgi:hypothetical protein